MQTNHIYQGDCLDVMRGFPDESIQCCITSPPYYGLRDYGTATWEGGNPECDHVKSEIRTGKGLAVLGERYRGGGKKQGKIKPVLYSCLCQKCGAKRIDNQIGLEKTPEEYVEKMVEVFREVRRVLRKDGTLWLNLGDSYNGSGKAGNNPKYQERHTAFGKLEKKERFGKPVRVKNLKSKDLIGIPWMVAFALRADDWYLRQDIIWHKPNNMPESVTDRCTKSHEYLFLLSKSKNYYFDNEAIKEPAHTTDQTNRDRDTTKLNNVPGRSKMGGLKTNHYTTRNKRSVWTVNTKPFKKAHFAVFPEKLVEPCILAGCPEGGVTLDPFMGAGTVGFVATENNRKYVGIELNPEYVEIANQRIKNAQPQLF